MSDLVFNLDEIHNSDPLLTQSHSSLTSPVTDVSQIMVDNAVFETPSHFYLNSSIIYPPAPFNTPVTPKFCKSQNSRNMENADKTDLTLPVFHMQHHTSDLNDSNLLTDLCEAAEKHEKEEKIKLVSERREKLGIAKTEYSLDDLLNEMPATSVEFEEAVKDNISKASKKKGTKHRKLKIGRRQRPSNKYGNLTMDEVEKVSCERQEVTEYKGAMSIAEKEIVRRGKINDSISLLRKIIPTVTDSTENTEVFEITARYAAFLREKTEGKYDRGYLYENLEL